jgi:hypothetical protein
MPTLRSRDYANGVPMAIRETASGSGQYSQGVHTPGTTQATVTTVAADVNTVTLKAANPNRRRLIIYNDSTAVLYIKQGTGASNTDYTFPVPSGAIVQWEPPEPYTGIVTGAWFSANGQARVTEET